MVSFLSMPPVLLIALPSAETLAADFPHPRVASATKAIRPCPQVARHVLETCQLALRRARIQPVPASAAESRPADPASTQSHGAGLPPTPPVPAPSVSGPSLD